MTEQTQRRKSFRPGQNCGHCGKILKSDTKHKCYIQPQKPSEPQTKYVFYGFQTSAESGKHEANFVCAIDFENNKWSVSGPSCVELFVKKFRQPKYKHYTFIAHIASGFDDNILLDYFAKQCITPQTDHARQ